MDVIGYQIGRKKFRNTFFVKNKVDLPRGGGGWVDKKKEDKTCCIV